MTATMVAEDLHVSYRIYASRQPNLRRLFATLGRAREYREIKAIRGITFEALRGQAIGVVGRNGSGKSTLLQALAGFLPATSGTVAATSQPTLLGVQAALKPNLSGRRNAELGCLALGMSQQEANEATPEVIAFSGLEEFADVPMRAYSSGMRARLHFAIATAIEPEILLIDEALAVGDAVFRSRSERRINELLDKAGTVMLVSHALGSIRDVCERTVWIDKGTIMADGETRGVLKEYKAFSDAQAD